MKTGASLKNRQGGAVAVMVGISIVVLVGFLALVMDLSRAYLARTGLQNAADAAALSGAKQLDGSAARICCGDDSAVAWARRTGGGPGPGGNPNNTFFGGDLSQVQVDVGTLDTANNKIRFSASPDGPWVSAAGAQASPGDKYFIKVDTASGTIKPLFAVVWDISNMGTFGTAVAGRYLLDVAPLGICAVDKTRRENGFIRGVAYNVPQLNPLGINADPLWINPVNAPPDACADVDPSWNSASKMAPFVCTGKTAVVRSLPGQVFVNTGGSASLEKELNSRFDDFQGSKCVVATAPPDANVKEYRCTNAGGTDGCLRNTNATNALIGLPRDWMQPGSNTIPSQQGIRITNRVAIDRTVPVSSSTVRIPPAATLFSNYGVLWSYSREKNFATGGDHTLADWGTSPLSQSLYKGQADQTANGYPPPVPAASSPPYFQTSGKYFFRPPNNPTAGVRNRRVLNVVIIDCSVPVSHVGPGNKCAALPTLAVGKFFMPVLADLPGELFLEFVEQAAPPLPPAEIRLYR